MSTAIERVEDILKSGFDINKYVELVREIFSTLKVVAPDKMKKEYSNFSSHVEASSHVGNYETPDGKKIAVFAVELKQQTYVENSRSTQRSFAKKLIENGGCDAALIAFYTPEDEKWRLSFVVLDYEMKIENGKMKTEENITPARRYSYLVGKGEPCHTAISRFGRFIRDNNSQPELEEIEESFSVEAVTKEFFDLYCEKFYQLVEYLESNKAFIAESERCGFSTEQFAKKLMGQIVFLYFLQKKGWLGVGVWSQLISERDYNNVFWCKSASAAQRQIIQQYLPTIYIQNGESYKFRGLSALENIPDDVEELIANNMPGDRNWGSGSKTFLRTWFDFAAKRDGKFYDKYLEPLFYATLNRNRGELGYSPILHCRVPFLSGGLFEPIDGYDWEHTDFNIPDEIFSNKKSPDDLSADGILDIFDRYNFTMSEDEPMEREVAIDPEMLGKVFENLLDVKDRKSKGAFYTPREIVHYMCQESLVNYLVANMNISESAIRSFILYGDFYKDTDTEKTLKVVDSNGKTHYEFDVNRELKISPEIFDPQNGINRINEIDKLLEEIRVADPAVGSGAFPLGMLNEIVRARQTLSAYMATSMRKDSVRYMYINERSPYNLKRDTIKNCIFAADIEPSAVDIAQLRLWLALVIDDEINPDAQNPLDGHKNPLPLPNLECNIVCGNSLSDVIDGYRLIPQSSVLGTEEAGQEFSWNQNELDAMIPKLVAAQDELFKCDDPLKKEEIRARISSIKDLMIHSELENLSQDAMSKYEESKKVASKPYVLWQIEFARIFKEKGGFDVVIGNPPYVSTKGQSDDSKKVLEGIYGYADDLYYHFIDKSFRILKKSGITAYITPDTYFTTLTKENLRKMILDRTLIRLVQLGHDVFESAMVSTAIVITGNEPNLTDKEVICVDVKNKDSVYLGDVYSIRQSKLKDAINGVFYMPTPFNTAISDSLEKIHTDLVKNHFEKVSTSREIEKNAKWLKTYRESLKAGEWTLVGLVTEGGQGLATANNGRFIGVRFDSKDAIRIKQTRAEKLAQLNARYKTNYELPQEEVEVWKLFEELKAKYGRDVFGQGYLYRIIPDELMADVSALSDEEKTKGIAGDKIYVPYDKGDKDGNRWYYETPYLIGWSIENVKFLKENSGKKGQGMPVVRNAQFYFREGFCYSDIKTFFLRAKMKGISIHDVKSMSLFPVCEKTPYYYLISILNTEITATFVYNFLNNTPSFQMNDCRMLPIPIPSESQLEECWNNFEMAVNIQKKFFERKIDAIERDVELEKIQELIDRWACQLYGFDISLLKGSKNIVR